MTTTKTDASYGSADIKILDGLLHVRLRIGMYLGDSSTRALSHLIKELVDNSVDEAMAGYGTEIVTTFNEDGSVTVKDFGRGIPVEPMPDGPHKGRSALDVVLTTLNSGGKFSEGGYKVSGGLHGVGASIVTALSKRVDVEVVRDQQRHTQTYTSKETAKGLELGVPAGPVKVAGKAPKGVSGTTITFWPEVSLFHDDHGQPLTFAPWSAKTMSDQLRHKSFVHPGLTFVLVDARDPKNVTTLQWCSQGGVADLVTELTAEFTPVSPVLALSGDDDVATLKAAVVWTVEGRDTAISYANGVSTPEGGTHMNGFRTAITEAIQKYIADKGLLKDKETAPTTRDIFGAATTVVSLMFPGPQFAGNAKSKLMNPEAAQRTRAIALPIMAKWLEENPADAKRVADLAISTMRSRTKSNADQLAARALLSKGSKSRNGLPAKLRDCTFKTDRPTEGILVEGESAASTAVACRNPSFQAILPLRGKPLNSYNEPIDRVAKSMADIILSMGCGIGEDFDINKFRYDRLLILADADDDGLHIRSLIMGFLYTWCPGFIEAGRLFYALPPLWTTTHKGERIYLENDAEKDKFLKANPKHTAHLGRCKGLGEMEKEDLALFVSDPNRKIGRVVIDDTPGFARLVETLLGSKSDLRKSWYLSRTGEDLMVGS